MVARSQGFSIGLSTEQLNRFADQIGQLADGVKPAADAAVDAVALQVDESAKKSTEEYLTLPRRYIDSKMSLERTRKNSARARVLADIEGTTLQRFGPGLLQQTQQVNWTNDWILQNKGGFSDWPGWTKRKGDQTNGRNIPENQKADGVGAFIFRGRGEDVFDYGFIQRLSNGNGFGLFLRSKNGKVRQAYGPSVYQTFRHYITANEGHITEQLADEFGKRLDEAIEKAV